MKCLSLLCSGSSIRKVSTLLFVLFVAICNQYAAAQTNLSLKTNTLRSIGGVGTLDRAQYFNYWGQITPGSNTNLGDLQAEVYEADGLHAFSGRETNDFPAAMGVWAGSNAAQEDPNNPGFFDHTSLRNVLQSTASWGYKNYVLQGDRFETLREAENPIYVTSGRKDFPDTPTQTRLYPDFLTNGTDAITNYAGYADFLNVYLEELVYGTGPGQGYLPFDKDRFYVEIMNEPQWANSTPDWNDVIAMHRAVTELVKEQHPQAQLGGATCCGSLDGHPDNSWDRMKAMMDDMVNWQTPSGDSVEFDFWSIHPYERYSVFSDGSYAQDNFFSPGHLSATMDLYESYSNQLFGEPKAFAVTEYGSWNLTNITNGEGSADDDYGDYARAEQQWDLVRDTREKLMVFMSRPDRIVNATPFLGPVWWEQQIPSSPAGDNAFWERDAAGVWHETIVASMFRMYNDLNGEYLEIENDNINFQTHAFRDGNKVYIMLNNLEKSNNTINLQAITGAASVTSASLDRIFWNGTEGVYEENLDVTSNWQNLTLVPEEGAVLTLTLDGPLLNDLATDVRTFYGDDTLAPINIPFGKSKVINIAAETDDALNATVRVAFTRKGINPNGEGFDIFVNGNKIVVPATGIIEYDDSDEDMVTREVDVPLGWLVDGNNEVYVDFFGDGGQLVTAVMTVTRSIGDFDGSGALDGGDLSALLSQFGPVAAGSPYDLAGDDGIVNQDDFDFWVEQLRGTSFEPGDFDVDGDVDQDDLAAWVAGFSVGDNYGQGDFNFDGDVDGNDFLNWQRAAASGAALATNSIVPEPTSVTLTTIMLLALAAGHKSKYRLPKLVI